MNGLENSVLYQLSMKSCTLNSYGFLKISQAEYKVYKEMQRTCGSQDFLKEEI